MQRYEACSIGHRRLRSRGLNPDNPVTPLVDSLVLSEHLWGNAEQAFDARPLSANVGETPAPH
jgi:hypothetical protein